MNIQHFQPYWRVTKATLLAFLLGFTAAIISFIPFGLTPKVWLNPQAFLLSNLSLYIVVFLFLRRKLKIQSPLNFGNFDWRIFGKLFLIFIPFLIFLMALVSLVNIPGFVEETIEEIFQQNPMIYFFNFVIQAPIMEELIFRGIILSYLLKHVTQLQAILFSSLLFGLTHGSPDQMLFSALGGVFLAYAYLKSNTLVVPILFHAFNNALGFVVMIL